MKTVWTKGQDAVRSKDIRASFTGSSLIRERMEEIVEDKIKATYSTKPEDYDNPSWAYKQADSAGYRRAMREILSILK